MRSKVELARSECLPRLLAEDRLDGGPHDPADSPREYESFVPRRDELLAVARYWEEYALRIEFRRFLMVDPRESPVSCMEFARKELRALLSLWVGLRSAKYGSRCVKSS